MPLLAATKAERWLAAIRIRRRKPVKPATLAGWWHSLDKWLLPLIGETRLGRRGERHAQNCYRENDRVGVGR